MGNVDSSELSTRHSVGQPSFLWPQAAAVSRAADGRRDPEAGRALSWKASSSRSVQNPITWPCPIASEAGMSSPLWLALSLQNVYYWGWLWSHSHRCPSRQPQPQHLRSGAEQGSAHQSIQWKVHSELGLAHSFSNTQSPHAEPRKKTLDLSFLSLASPHLHALTFLLCTPAVLAREVLLTRPQALLKAPTEPLLP